MATLPSRVSPTEASRLYRENRLDVVRVVNPEKEVSEEDCVDINNISESVQAVPLATVSRRICIYCGGTPANTIVATLESCRAAILAKAMVDFIRHMEQDEWRTSWLHYRAINAVLVAWMFPSHRKEHRASDQYHRVVAATSSLSGIPFIASHRSLDRVLKASRGFEPAVQEHLLGKERHVAALACYLQTLDTAYAISPHRTSPDQGYQYVLVGTRMLYWGFTGQERARGIGIVARYLEHLVDLFRARREKNPKL